MGDSKLYSAHDIEKLKQKVANYRETLTTLKTGNSIDDYLFMKSEFNGFKTQIANLDGEMQDKQTMQIEEYEQQVKNFSVQIDSLNQTVKELDQDISLIMNKLSIDDRNNLLEEVDTLDNPQRPLNSANEIKENDSNLIIVEATKTKDQPHVPSIRNSNLPPTYKQLRTFANEAKKIEDLPTSSTTSESIAIPKTHEVEREHFRKQSFPSNGITPNQTYYGHFKNSATQSINNSVGKSFPVIVNKNKSFIITDGNPEQNYEDINDLHNIAPSEIPDEVNNVAVIEETIKPIGIFDEVNNVAVIEETIEPIGIFDEVNNVAAIEETIEPIGIFDEVTNVAAIEMEKEPFEIPYELKRQQHKNKETSRLFNLFRKKQ